MSEERGGAGEKPVSFRDWVAVLGAILGAFMAVLDIQITNSSLEDIQGGIGASVDEGSWITTSYLVAEIMIIPLTGWLCHVFATRRYLIVTCSLFVVFSILCALSGSLGELIVWRAGQGLTGGALIPLALTIILQKLPPSRQALGTTLFGFTATFAPAIGPVIGGWLTDTFGWEYIFYINVFPGAVLVTAVWWAIDQEPPHLGDFLKGDWVGIALMAFGFAAMIAVLEEGERKNWFTTEWIRWATLMAVVCIPAFVVHELTTSNRFINLRLLLHRFLGPGCVMATGLGLGLFGSVYLIPLYLTQVQGYNAFQTGQVLAWAGLPQLLIFPFVPLLMARIDWRLLVAFGFGLFAISCVMNAYMSPYTAEPQLRVAMLVRALGQPFMIVPLLSLSTQSIPPDGRADASALFNMLRNLGGSVGTSMITTLTVYREQYHFSIISERITTTGLEAQAHLGGKSPHAIDPSTRRLLGELQTQVRLNADTMAYADCFFLMAMFLFMCITVLVIVPKPSIGAGAAAP